MTAIIYQSTIDKKRKKCGITIETTDKKRLERISSNLQFIA